MPNYRTREYGSQITLGMKVAAVLALFGLMFCLWIAVPKGQADDKDLKASTARLTNAIRSAVLELKPPPSDPSEVWQRLSEMVQCPKCEGTGQITDGEGNEVCCPVCKGTGVSTKQGPGYALRRYILDRAVCRRCNGTGQTGHAKCPECGGTGYFRDKANALVLKLSRGSIPDAWGRKLRLEIAGSGKNLKVEVRSSGPDGRFNTKDDIVAGSLE